MKKRKKQSIRYKVTTLLLSMVAMSVFLSGIVSLWGLSSMKSLSADSNYKLGQTAAEDSEQALEDLAAQNLETTAQERVCYIEEKFNAVAAYVHGIAAQAKHIYENPEQYPDREVSLPVKGSTLLAPQLLWSESLAEQVEGPPGYSTVPPFTEELLKLGNLQDMLVQYNANNHMVSSSYLATKSGWLIQADYISGSKYSGDSEIPDYYEAVERQWYQRATWAGEGQVVYSDVIRDVHKGGNCIVCAEPVFLNGEIVAVAGVGSYLDTVNETVLNTTIGDTGYAFLIGRDGQVVVSPKAEGETAAVTERTVDLRRSDNGALADIAADVLCGGSGVEKITLDGREVYLAYVPLQSLGWGFVTVMEVEEVIAPAKESQNRILSLAQEVSENQGKTIRKMLVSFVAVMAAVFFMICLWGTAFSRKLTAPIRTLTREVAQINGGNLNYHICLETGDEVEELGEAFNRMTAQIRDYVENLASVTAEKERIRSEIQVASRLQADMLPKAEEMFQNREEFTLAASMTPAKGVGGDFYDFFLLDEDRLALVMADVSGKGVPAALFMVVSRTVIKSRLQAMEKEEKKGMLAKAAEEINNILCANNRNEMFVTVWMGVLTLSTGRLKFVNAGHCLPLICRKEGACEYETSLSGLVFAGMEDSRYRQWEVRMHPGDTLLLYTDGVTEATSTMKELYGEKRLQKAVQTCREKKSTPEELLQVIWQDVEEFQKGEEQFDDITMLAVTWHGNGFLEKTGKPDIKKMEEFEAFIEDCLKEGQISKKTILKMQMAADEIFSNICHYSGATEVTLGVRTEETAEGRNAVLCFTDDGIPFNPLEKADPNVEEVLEERKTGGLGIYLVKKQMDRISYTYEDGRNRLTIYKQD